MPQFACFFANAGWASLRFRSHGPWLLCGLQLSYSSFAHLYEFIGLKRHCSLNEQLFVLNVVLEWRNVDITEWHEDLRQMKSRDDYRKKTLLWMQNVILTKTGGNTYIVITHYTLIFLWKGSSVTCWLTSVLADSDIFAQLLPYSISEREKVWQNQHYLFISVTTVN